MTPQPPGDPTAQATQMWEAACRSMTEGLRQAQDFWTRAAQSWGEMTGAWIGQLNRSGQALSGDHLTILRELQEASFTVGQAWMRLPLILAAGAQPQELQEAITRLTEAQGRAYRLWTEALTRTATGGKR
jgi:hypothetical protein